jgi:hypothetical protein
LTSREWGVGIDGVTTAGGEAAFLFLFFFFCSAAFTVEIAAATAEADFFTIVNWSCAGTSRRQCLGLPQPRHQYLRRPPLTSQTRKTPVDDLLEACTCLT